MTRIPARASRETACRDAASMLDRNRVSLEIDQADLGILVGHSQPHTSRLCNRAHPATVDFADVLMLGQAHHLAGRELARRLVTELAGAIGLSVAPMSAPAGDLVVHAVEASRHAATLAADVVAAKGDGVVDAREGDALRERIRAAKDALAAAEEPLSPVVRLRAVGANR